MNYKFYRGVILLKMMHRLSLTLLCLSILLLVGGCQIIQTGESLPPLSPVTLAQSDLTLPDTDEVVEEDESADEEWAHFTDEDHSLTLYYPAAWLVFDPSLAELEMVFAAVEGVAVDELAAMVQMLTASAENLSIFAALGFLIGESDEEGARYINNFTVVVLPTNGLSLKSYASLVSKQLETIPMLDVEMAEVLPGLRPDGLEVASIRYTVDGALYQLQDEQLSGWQVVLLDEQGTALLVLSFTALSTEFEKLEPQLAEIIHRIEF
jgi:hypothetical protein